MGHGGIILLLSTSALDNVDYSASRIGHFISGEKAPGTHWIGSWIGLRTDLDAVEWRKKFTSAAK
jgi:hypothetical protein